jgi:hypothetical protein
MVLAIPLQVGQHRKHTAVLFLVLVQVELGEDVPHVLFHAARSSVAKPRERYMTAIRIGSPIQMMLRPTPSQNPVMQSTTVMIPSGKPSNTY